MYHSITKNQLRKFARSNISAQKAYNKQLDLQIFAAIVAYISALYAVDIGIYWPNEYEVNLLELLQKFPNLNFALPKVIDQRLTFVSYCSVTSLQLNHFKVYEPSDNEEVLPQVILVPGLAFSTQGYRIGYGKGYYDRYIAIRNKCYPVIAVGVCRHYQLLPAVPFADHDQKMNSIITELGKFDVENL